MKQTKKDMLRIQKRTQRSDGLRLAVVVFNGSARFDKDQRSGQCGVEKEI